MTVNTLHSHCFYMHFVFANVDNLFMTADAGPVIRAYLGMGLVAFVTVKLHRRIGRELNFYGLFNNFWIGRVMRHIHRRILDQFLSDRLLPVAEETFLSARFQIPGSVSMTVEACEVLHPGTMNFLALVAPETEPLFGSKLVNYISVALGAFDLFHEVVLRMAGRGIDLRRFRISLVSFPVTAHTEFPGNNDFPMSFRDGLGSVEDEIDKKPVLLRYRQVMTVMTVDIIMLTCGPRVISGFHEVTADTKLGIILSKIIKFKSNDTAPNDDDKQEYGDDDLPLEGHTLLEPFHILLKHQSRPPSLNTA